MPAARVNIIPWNLHHRSDPAFLWNSHSTHIISMKLKLEVMYVTFNLILSACVSFFSFDKLILHSIHFDVAKKEVFQDTQGMQHSVIPPHYCANGCDFRNGVDIFWLFCKVTWKKQPIGYSITHKKKLYNFFAWQKMAILVPISLRHPSWWAHFVLWLTRLQNLPLR